MNNLILIFNSGEAGYHLINLYAYCFTYYVTGSSIPDAATIPRWSSLHFC